MGVLQIRILLKKEGVNFLEKGIRTAIFYEIV